MSAPALELRSVSRRFGEVAALVDASLSVAPGTLHALLGENGAGKTTLMRIAYGMLRPTSGEVRVDGQARELGSPADGIRAGIGMVQQHPSNVAAMTVWENVLLGGSGMLHPSDARARVRALATTLGFGLDTDAIVGELPVAAQQRLEILKAVSRNARILILDEPTAILAPEEAADLYAWLRSFANGGGTAVVVTHKLEEARRFADDLTVLRAGRTALTGRSADVSAAALAQAMIGEAESPAVPEAGTPATGAPVVSARALNLRDDRKLPVIRNASFDVRAGEIVGIAGIEGSGHQQLLLALAGRHAIESGTLDGVSEVAFVPEDRHRNSVALALSLTENAAIRGAGARRGTMRWRRLAEKVAKDMARFDVRAPGPDVHMRTLSGGNQQKFVLARELDGNPRLIVAENPTRGLDIRASVFVREQLRAARARGAAIVLYSSDLDELLDLADRVLVVHAGEVTSAPRDRARIGAAMLGVA